MPLGPELVELLLETSDAFRAMLETTLATPPRCGGSYDLRTCRSHAGDVQSLQGRRSTGSAKRSKTNEPKAELQRDSSKPEPEPEREPERRQEPPIAAPPALAEGLIFDPVPEASLAEETMYREIYAGMACDSLREMRRALDGFLSAPLSAQTTLIAEAERLGFAAKQIGMLEWRDALAEFVALGEPSIEQTQSLVAELTAMLARDFGVPEFHSCDRNAG